MILKPPSCHDGVGVATNCMSHKQSGHHLTQPTPFVSDDVCLLFLRGDTLTDNFYENVSIATRMNYGIYD